HRRCHTRRGTLLRGPTRSQELRLRRTSAAAALSHQNPASFLHHRRYSVYDPTGLPNRAFLQRDRGCCMMQTNLNEPANNAMQLTGRPGTHLAASAPPHISPKGGAQGARPSRPAADRGRWAVQIAMRGTMMRLIQMLLLSIPLCFRSACATEPLSRITRDAFEGSWECLHWNREIVAMMQ